LKWDGRLCGGRRSNAGKHVGHLRCKRARNKQGGGCNR
jgi:hypothetical protein